MADYKRKEDAELKKIARDLLEGRLFSSNQITDAKLFGTVFIPLYFLDREALDSLIEQGIMFIYEYIEKAGPRSINGMPIFFSCNMLDSVDYDRMMAYAQEIDKVIKENKERLEGVVDSL